MGKIFLFSFPDKEARTPETINTKVHYWLSDKETLGIMSEEAANRILEAARRDMGTGRAASKHSCK